MALAAAQTAPEGELQFELPSLAAGSQNEGFEASLIADEALCIVFVASSSHGRAKHTLRSHVDVVVSLFVISGSVMCCVCRCARMIGHIGKEPGLCFWNGLVCFIAHAAGKISRGIEGEVFAVVALITPVPFALLRAVCSQFPGRSSPCASPPLHRLRRN